MIFFLYFYGRNRHLKDLTYSFIKMISQLLELFFFILSIFYIEFDGMFLLGIIVICYILQTT